MRETFTTLQTIAHNGTQTESSDTTVNTFLKDRINVRKREIESELDIYRTQITSTASTVADQQFYHYPPDIGKIESIKVTIGSVDYVCHVVNSQKSWDQINSVTVSGEALPFHYFPRKSDFGIYPTPQGVYTITMVYYPRNVDFNNEDYTTGTVTVTNGSAAVTGSGTTFTAAMVGRYFKADDDGQWYKISAQGSATSITLESVFEGTTASGASYTIGESPELPEELHQLPAYGAIADYFLLRRGDMTKYQFWNNIFYTGDGNNNERKDDTKITGGLLHAKNKYGRRSSSGVIRKNIVKAGRLTNDKIWATSISAS